MRKVSVVTRWLEGSRVSEGVPEIRIRLRRMPILERKEKKPGKKMIRTGVGAQSWRLGMSECRRERRDGE